MTLLEPSRRLPEAAKRFWRLTLLGQLLVALVVSLVLADVWEEAGIPRLLPAGVVLVLGAVAAVVVPALRWRRWRYEVREDAIDLRHGMFTVRRTLVPIRRVQHVDTRTGLVQGLFALATVSFHTAAGSTEIPALDRAEAEDVRRRVGELAHLRDDV